MVVPSSEVVFIPSFSWLTPKSRNQTNVSVCWKLCALHSTVPVKSYLMINDQQNDNKFSYSWFETLKTWLSNKKDKKSKIRR